MNKEERAAYQREYRKRRKQPVNDSVNVNGVNKLAEDGEALLLALVGKYDAQEKRIAMLEEVVAQLARNVEGLEKAQVKSVALGISVPRLSKVQLVNPLSKEAQSSLKAMPYLNRGDGGH